MTKPAAFAGFFLLSLLATTGANAQSYGSQNDQLCAQLEGDLARLQRAQNSTSSRNYEKYDAAYHKQLAEIDSAERRAKRDSCYGGRGFLFRSKPKASCPALLKRIDKMKRNLAAIDKKRNQFSPAPRDDGQQRTRILSQLAQAGCGEQYDRFANLRPVRQRRGLFSRLFEPNSGGVREYNPTYSDIPQIGTYRTVCVRTCDGFFFPISFSTTQANFARDEGICQARCPGSPAQLYVYQNPGQTSDDMVSLSGQTYRSLETAFLYKQEYVNGCSCQAPVSQMTSLTTSDLPQTGRVDQQQSQQTQPPVAPLDAGPVVPIPMPKQSAMIDPDTQAAKRLGLAFNPYRPPEISSDKSQVRTADGRSIRIVGPQFFGNQE